MEQAAFPALLQSLRGTAVKRVVSQHLQGTQTKHGSVSHWRKKVLRALLSISPSSVNARSVSLLARAATVSVSLSFLPAQYQTALGFYKFRDLHHHNLAFPSSQKMARPYTGRAIPSRVVTFRAAEAATVYLAIILSGQH